MGPIQINLLLFSINLSKIVKNSYESPKIVKINILPVFDMQNAPVESDWRSELRFLRYDRKAPTPICFANHRNPTLYIYIYIYIESSYGESRLTGCSVSHGPKQYQITSKFRFIWLNKFFISKSCSTQKFSIFGDF